MAEELENPTLSFKPARFTLSWKSMLVCLNRLDNNLLGRAEQTLI